MYEVRETLGGAPLPSGTNVLVSGPDPAENRDLAFDLLSEGRDRGEAAVVFTTDGDAAAVRSRLGPTRDDRPAIGVVDCESNDGGGDPGSLSRHVASPGDFTGAGVATSELIEAVGGRGAGTRVAVHSASDLLARADVKTVFRFLHALSGRIGAADALGVATVDADAHDQQTVTTLRQLFDGLIEVRRGPNGDRERRVRGLSSVEATWERF